MRLSGESQSALLPYPYVQPSLIRASSVALQCPLGLHVLLDREPPQGP